MAWIITSKETFKLESDMLIQVILIIGGQVQELKIFVLLQKFVITKDR